ncbi:hypothetical protein MON38_06765 [Hymenobacter sp. DH14]|uniref:DUF4304 domain-containing protein n=1 Tax=Hymenobacter cyanobacteriorum TaxID=2926463 RepID=A0A9X2AEE1_9BACT|nr:hypothetical protein [Hymenobacter cyanobacteriorum]MCI1187116.1 hypothetical protein [Hymenobacter cyanobacteriorum]
MTNRELRNALLERLASDLAPYGFVLNKSLAEFTKRSGEGWEKFQLIFLVRSNSWEINPAMLIRIDIVENIYQKASYFDKKYHKTTPTVGISLEDFVNDGKGYRFDLSNEEDIERCYQSTMMLFKKVVIPFFSQYNNIEQLDREINVENRESIFGGPKYEGNLGIILAKLACNPRYNQLESKYHCYYQQLQDGFYLAEYEGIVEALRLVNS